jgi:hypothetical protein
MSGISVVPIAKPLDTLRIVSLELPASGGMGRSIGFFLSLRSV